MTFNPAEGFISLSGSRSQFFSIGPEALRVLGDCFQLFAPALSRQLAKSV